MNYKINKDSWHFRLWTYLIHNSLVPVWFLRTHYPHTYVDKWGYTERDLDRPEKIPNDLCSYINRLFLYFFFQVPSLLVMGLLIFGFCIFAPLFVLFVGIMQGFDHVMFGSGYPIESIGTIALGVETCLGLFVGACHIREKRWLNKGFDWLADKIGKYINLPAPVRHFVDVSGSNLGKGAVVTTKAFVSPFRIIWDFIISMHHKVCLKLEFDS